MKLLHHNFHQTLIFTILLMAVGLAAVLWYVLVHETTSPAPAKQISSFDECVAAGNPVIETYPPQCRADGKTYTDTDEVLASQLQDVTSSQGTFTIGIPRGWGPVVSAADIDQLMMNGDKQPVSDPTKTVEVNTTEFYGHDGPVIFVIYTAEVVDMSLPRGDETSFTVGKGEDELIGKRYAYEYPADTEEGIGARLAGDRDYYYHFTLKDGTFLRASYHVYGVDPKNLVQTFEESLSTLRAN